MEEPVIVEATAALFDRSVDNWAGARRRMLPIAGSGGGSDVPGALEELPGAEEWIGGGQTIVLPSDPKRPARRVVWRARGSCTWLAEFVAGKDVPRNGMQLPHGLLSRDALAVEVVDGSPTRAGARDEAALLWTLSPNLVLRCVAFKRPPPLQQQPSQHRHPRANTGEPTTGGATASAPSLASLFDQLPRNEQAEAMALRPPAGSDYPSCCAFVLSPEGRHLVVGYPTGKIQLIRLLRPSFGSGNAQDAAAMVGPDEGASGGGGGGLEAMVVREFPASGVLAYLNPLNYRANAQPPASPVVAVTGQVLAGGEGDMYLFSLHADRKLRIWAAKGKGTALTTEIALPGALDRGLVYSGCSKVSVVACGDGGAHDYRLLVTLTEPSHSRLWVSAPFRTGADAAALREASFLGECCFEEAQLAVDALLLPTTTGEEGKQGSLRLWAALANDGLAYADVGAGTGQQQQQQQRRRRLTRLWTPPSSSSAIDDDGVRLLLPPPAEAAAAGPPPAYGGLGPSAGSAFSDHSTNTTSSSKDAALRQQLWCLHQRLGGGWAAVHRHIEGGCLRLLAAPHRHSALGLRKAMERFSASSSSSSSSLTAPAQQQRAGTPVPSGGGGSGSSSDDSLVGERLWEAVAACVRREAEAEAEKRRMVGAMPPGQGQQSAEASAFIEGERRARALWAAWGRFVAIAEESREVLMQPLGLVPPLWPVAEKGEEDPVLAFGPLTVRVDRATTPTPLPLPLPRTPALAAFHASWLAQHAPTAPLELSRLLHDATAKGLPPDPSALRTLAAAALARRSRVDVGLSFSTSSGDGRVINLAEPADRGLLLEEVTDLLEALRGHHDLFGLSSSSAPWSSSSSHTATESTSIVAATALSAAALGALQLAAHKARTALLLLAHLESLGLLPARFLSSLPHQAAVALNRAWLLLATCCYPQLAPSQKSPPNSGVIGRGKAPAMAAMHGKGLCVLEALLLQQGSALLSPAGSNTAAASDALRRLLHALPHRLFSFLESTEQYRYLSPWARGLLNHTLLLPPETRATDNNEQQQHQQRKWERLVVYSHLSEARRASATQRPRLAEQHLAKAVACLRRWDRCLCPPLLVGEEDGMVDEVGEGGGEADARPVDASDVGQARLAHYVQAVALLEQQSLSGGGGSSSSGTRRLADLAYAGLREVLPLSAEPSNAAERAARRWAHRKAAALWATVFRACTDTSTAGSSSTQCFEEAFLAMRAEVRVGWELTELLGAGGGEGQAAAATTGRSKNTKLTFLLGELCERGRLDLVCLLPWAQGNAEDEVSQIQERMRNNARFSAIEGVDGEEEDQGSASSAMMLEGPNTSSQNTEPPPVDYYRASYAFLVQQGNHQQAASDLYRLVQRLEAAAAYEDSLPRLQRKVEALSAIHNALCLIRAQQQTTTTTTSASSSSIFPFFKYAQEDRLYSTTGTATKRMACITLPRIEQELAYAVAARHYLEATQGSSGGNHPPLRPLGLAPVPPLPPGANPAAVTAGGDEDSRRARAARAQAATAAGLLCRVGLYESASNLLRAFGLPLTPVVRALARAAASLKGRREGGAMVREDGPGWEVGDAEEEEEEGMTREEARRAAFLRLAEGEARALGEEGNVEAVEEERAAAEGAEAAAWLLKDLVQGCDWAHAFGLHVEAARYLLAVDSFAPLPRWLSAAFTRGVEARFVHKKRRLLSSSSSSSSANNVAEYVDQCGVRRIAGAADAGALLGMHVDKAVYLLQRGGGQGQGKVGEGVLREALHLLVAALGYAKDTVDTAVEQLHATAPSSSSSSAITSKQTFLPRTQIAALVVRTREALALAREQSANTPGGASSINNLVQAAEDVLATLGKMFKLYDGNVGDAEASLGVTTAVSASVGGGGGFGGPSGFRFG